MKNTHAKPIRWAAMWLLTLMAAGLGSLFSSGMTSPLFAYAFAEDQGANGSNELDGTIIESLNIHWIASPDDNLSLSSASDNPMSMQFQLDVALGGQHDYAPGEIKLSFLRKSGIRVK